MEGYHINTVPPPQLAELLREVERHGRTDEQDKANLTEQMATLALILHRDPDTNGMGLAALGGIKYLLERLMGFYQTSQSPEELRDTYCGIELGRYAVIDDSAIVDPTVESMKEYGRFHGLVIRAIKVQCSDGQERVIFASHLNQTSYDGTIVLKEGEIVHNPAYFPPPFRCILDQLKPA